MKSSTWCFLFSLVIYLSLMLPHIVSALDILNGSSPTSISSMLSNCSVNPRDHDNEDDIKLLQVPVWDDKPKTRSISHSAKHDISLTWSDSLLDEASDHSHSPSRYWNNALENKNNFDEQKQRHRRLRQSKEQWRRKHQVQADLLVERNFIGQLRQSEDDYAQMRIHYEHQIRSLQNQLIDMQCQRDHALGNTEINDRKRKNNDNNNYNNTTNNGLNTNDCHRRRPHQLHVTRHTRRQPTTLSSLSSSHKSITQQVNEIKLRYEGQIQRLSSKNQEWERKYTQTVHTMTSAHTHAEQIVRRLRSKTNQLQTERKQFEQAMKHDNARLRNQLSKAKQELQQLKNRDTTIQQKRDPHCHPVHRSSKNNHQYTQQINKVPRKATTEDVALKNTLALKRIQQKTTKTVTPETPVQNSAPPPIVRK
ncbi:hypothetical protein BCR42DRAFT_417232 [Absidia repens]|uniref:Uncharacterized protein n=1 Tax=Absidia repens TaxID=90262 RepID=A0A1X2IDL4_9FUNG|nr:hypothetical protein BCR42DRAFT_417232 [Absidia repens]